MHRRRDNLAWMDGIKAFALLGILLNHLVELFGPGPWFTNPGADWPGFAARFASLFPSSPNPLVASVRFLGWLGDSGPGVFILLSGLGLTWASLGSALDPLAFYRRRLLRLFPLYVAAHFTVLAGSLVLAGDQPTFASPRTLLSLLGLRFTAGLFFWLSPSWWFVWLILQLYLVFPLLHRLLRRVGVLRFLAITFAVSIAARAGGLFGLVPVGNLYFWMTGIFFGTRLAEFAAGMALAVWLRQREESGSPDPPGLSVFAVALPTYLVGFGCSLFWAGAVVSNLLVTIGLTGLFYAGWTLAGGLRLRRALVWLGMESYGIYLLHQPPLLWASELLSERPWILLVAALLLLVASLPAAWLLRRLVEWIEGRIAAQPSPGLGSTVDVGAVAVGVVCILLQPAVGTTRPGRALALVMGLAAVALAARELTEVRRGGCRVLRVSVLTALALALFVLPSGASLLILGLAAGLLDAAARALAGERLPARLAAACAFGVLLLGGELALHRWAPLEAGRWGEFPALETHPTRVYALRPSATTRLHYNNYDYVLRTNSLGLPGPEVSPSRSTPETLRVLVIGDAFTMPEGLQVEDSYPALLQARLSECLAPRPVQVINAGVTGYGPAEEVPQLKELTPLLRPDVVIWEFFVNEFSEVLLTPEERHFDIGFPVEGRRTSFRGRLQIGARARWLQDRAAELLTGRSGQRRYAKALLDHYESGPSRVYTERSEAAIRAALAGARRAADGVGAQLLVFYVPGAIAVSRPQDIAYYPWSEPLGDRRRYDLERPLKVLTRLAAPLGIPVVDLTPELRSGTKRPVYFPESWHWNREGHVVAATVMLRTLSQRGILGTSQGEGPACGD